MKKVDLIKLGDGYITAPLALTEGNYRLTDFFVMSAGGEVLYATPKEGSDLASLVTDPLPMNFSVTPNGIVNLDVQVVDVDQQIPEDFGYVTFGVEVVGSDYAISLFISEGNELSLASGKLELYQGNDLVYEQNLDAKVNTVNFKGDPNQRYELFILKEGFTIRTREFMWHELTDELNGRPLVFTLEPAFTIVVKHHDVFDDNLPFTFNLNLKGLPGAEYEVIIDWGDGTVDHVIEYFKPDGYSPTQFMLHFYSADLAGQRNVVNITGSLSKVDFFFLSNPLPLSMSAVDFAALPNIDAISWMLAPARNDTPENIDVSHNSKLTWLNVSGSRTKHVNNSNNPVLTGVDLWNTEVSNEYINEVIMNLPERSGIFPSRVGFAFGRPTNSDQQNLAILTEESRLKLIALRDTYGWSIYPNP
jgi:hypothetical protein